jgi:hypothetical protein
VKAVLCAAVLGAALLAGCVDSTGSALVTFQAVAAGPETVSGGQLEGDTGLGYHLILTQATLHIGGIYLKLSPPKPGAQAQACVQIGSAQFYSGEVRQGLDVDALAADPQPFPVAGEGTADLSPVAELWLISDGLPIEAETDNKTIAQIAGTASKDGTTYPFTASITISQGNRGLMSTDAAQPGAHPVCAQRIVTPILAGFTPTQGGTLLVRIDPLAWFNNVEFSEVPADDDHPGQLAFPDRNDDQQSLNLFTTLHSTAAYSITFAPGSTP